MQRRKVTFKLDPKTAQRVRLEGWTRLHLGDMRQLKPSQRCAACWQLVRKTLAERMHVCPHCGHMAPRDQDSATVVIDAHAAQQIPLRDPPGTGVAARPKPLPRQRGKSKSLPHETPATTPCLEWRERSCWHQHCPPVSCRERGSLPPPRRLACDAMICFFTLQTIAAGLPPSRPRTYTHFIGIASLLCSDAARR